MTTKRLSFAMLVAIAAISASVFTSCKGKNGGSDSPFAKKQPESVVINGVRWATRNVDAPGTFAKNPEDVGMLYQWNRKIGWNSTNPMIASNGSTTWDSSRPHGNIWKAANNPSPAGYRVPTIDEIEKLLDTTKVSYKWTTLNGIDGQQFTDKTTGAFIFMPATSRRYNYENGSLISGGYWFSPQDSQIGMYLDIVIGSGEHIPGISNPAYCDGFSVRCVADESDKLPESVVINGVKWATCNVDAPGTFADKPEDYGMYYQWNRKTGWFPTTILNSNDGTTWDDSTPSGTKWEKANDPSPAGYRVPTIDEIKKLLDTDKVRNEWTLLNGVTGRQFTDKTSGAFIFMPDAPSYYNCYDENNEVSLCGDGNGKYWSSTQNESYDRAACELSFSYDRIYWSEYGSRTTAQSVRPVAE
jgi:uncharacterized protein (TIGR02145 family)